MRHSKVLAAALFLLSSPAWALSSYLPGDLSALTSSGVDSLIKTVAISSDHRAYMPASALGATVGLDVGVEVTAIQLPSDFLSAMAAAGVTSSLPTYLALPKLNFHKGLPRGVDLGFSYVGYQNYKIYGAEVKWAFLRGGMAKPAVAARLSQSYSSLFFMKTRTSKLDLVASKGFALIFEPYVGAGMQVSSGELDVPIGGTTGLNASVSGSSSYTAAHYFVGLPINLTLLKLVTEYDYSSAGVKTFGAKVSLSF